MSGIEISSGGAIAVDSTTLRTAAARCRGISTHLQEAIHGMREADAVLGDVRFAWDPGTPIGQIGPVDELDDAVAEMHVNLLHAADLYDAVEVLAERKITELDLPTLIGLYADTGLGKDVFTEALEWLTMWAQHPDGQFFVKYEGEVSNMTTMALAIRALLGAAGLGVRDLVPGVTWPKKPATGVSVSLTKPPTVGQAPDTLTDVAKRIPTGQTATIRVEKYEMPDGTQRFTVYIPGTRTGDDTFDMDSNLEMYLDSDDTAASYEAVRQALEQAGAEPGDSVIAVGHSQGGMIAELLAQDPTYNTTGTYSFGSPIEAEAPTDSLHIVVRNSEDAVPLLTGGGYPGQNGSRDSFVVTRETGELTVDLDDMELDAHQLQEYIETAQLIDASDDPRVDAMRDQLAELDTATKVTVYEFNPDQQEE